MSDFDPHTQSIFESRHGAHANACVGENGYADTETYAIGYFEATEVLIKCVLNHKNLLTQDTLVYPILFNFRHGIELSVKRVLQVLDEAGVSSGSSDHVSHDLKKLWAEFLTHANKDRRLRKAAKILTPVVDQIHEADPIAQEFRYATKNDGGPSLASRHIVDLFTVLELATYAKTHFDALFSLAEKINIERKFDSFTTELNREELDQLSRELPDIQTWRASTAFDAVKIKWKREYGLSNNAFCRAIEIIKTHREFAGNIGHHTAFNALSEDILEIFMKASLEILKYNTIRVDSVREKRRFHDPTDYYFNKAGVNLTKELVREVSALCYLGRDGRYSEEYPMFYKRHAWPEGTVDEKVIREGFMHVFRKPTFAKYMIRALRMTGYPQLAFKYDVLLKPIKAAIPPIRELKISDIVA